MPLPYAALPKGHAPSTPAKEHAFGVDDGSLHRHSVPMFLVRVTSAARYWVIFAQAPKDLLHQPTRRQDEYGCSVAEDAASESL